MLLHFAKIHFLKEIFFQKMKKSVFRAFLLSTVTSSDINPTETPFNTNPAGYPTAPPGPAPDPSAFPLPNPDVDSQCGRTFIEPVISNFDFVGQDKFVRGEINDWNPELGFQIARTFLIGCSMFCGL